MKIKIYEKLNDSARSIRTKVFVEEQGFQNEFDEIDGYAVHFVAFSEDDFPIGVCRVFGDNELNSFILGRLAVLKEYRGNGCGAELVREALRYVKKEGGKRLTLHAQCASRCFYEKLGFIGYGETEYDEGCPHIKMYKTVE